MSAEKEKEYTYSRKLSEFFTQSAVSVGKYIVGKIITSTIIGVIAFIVFRILDIDLAWLLALILGLTNFVPVIGPWVGLVLCAVIIVFFRPVFALYTSLTALVLQITEQFFLLPVIVGKAVDLKPLLIISVLVAGSLAFGFWGVVFAIPVAAVLKIWYNIFITGKKEESNEFKGIDSKDD